MEPKNENNYDPYGPITFLIVGHGRPDINYEIPEILYKHTFESEPDKIFHACPKNVSLLTSFNPRTQVFPFLRTACQLKGHPLDLIKKGHYVNSLISSDSRSQPLDGIYECRPEGPVRLYKFKNSHLYQLKDLVELISSKYFYEKIVVVACRGNDNSSVQNVTKDKRWMKMIQTEPAEYIDCPSILLKTLKNSINTRNVEHTSKRQRGLNGSINRSIKKKRRMEKYGPTPREKLRSTQKSFQKNHSG